MNPKTDLYSQQEQRQQLQMQTLDLQNESLNITSISNNLFSIQQIILSFETNSFSSEELSSDKILFIMPSYKLEQALIDINLDRACTAQASLDKLVDPFGISVSFMRIGLFSHKFLGSMNSYNYDFMILFLHHFAIENSIDLIISTELADYLSANPDYLSTMCQSEDVNVSYKLNECGISTAVPGRQLKITTTYTTDLLHQILRIRNLDAGHFLFSSKKKKLPYNILPDLEYYTPLETMVDKLPQEGIINTETSKNLPDYARKTESKQCFKILELPKKQITYLIGKKGARITELRHKSQCDIKIIATDEDKENQNPIVTNGKGEIIQYIRLVAKDEQTLEKCLEMIASELLIYRCRHGL